MATALGCTIDSRLVVVLFTDKFASIFEHLLYFDFIRAHITVSNAVSIAVVNDIGNNDSLLKFSQPLF